MATIKRISLHRDAKINLDNYESASVGITLTADLEPDEDPGNAYTELATKAKKALAMEIKQIVKYDPRRWVGEIDE